MTEKILTLSSLNIQDQLYPVVYKSFKKACRLRVRFTKEENTILVTGPTQIAVAKIYAFLDQATDWLILHKPKPKAKVKQKFEPGFTFVCLDHPLTLVHHFSKSISVLEDKGKLHVMCPLNQLNITVINWIKKQIILYIKDICQNCGEQKGLIPQKIRIGSAKTRWGSCSSTGHLNFTWRLALAPKEIIFYVVIHELCHLQEMNHKPSFWKLVESLCPAYKKQRLWLKQNGSALNLWFS